MWRRDELDSVDQIGSLHGFPRVELVACRERTQAVLKARIGSQGDGGQGARRGLLGLAGPELLEQGIRARRGYGPAGRRGPRGRRRRARPRRPRWSTASPRGPRRLRCLRPAAPARLRARGACWRRRRPQAERNDECPGISRHPCTSPIIIPSASKRLAGTAQARGGEWKRLTRSSSPACQLSAALPGGSGWKLMLKSDG